MASPVFTLEALQAHEGDSLLLHYGHLNDPKLIVIDGGPKDIFKLFLEPRLNAIRAKRGGGVLGIRMVMVSHIDNDHVVGIRDMMKKLRDLKDAAQVLPYDVLTLWHNSFDDITTNVGASVAAVMQSAKLKPHTDAAAVVAGVPEGRQLRMDADALAINMNSGFDDLIHFDSTAKPLKISKELTFTVLGPRKAELDALEGKWNDFLEAEKKKKKKAGGGTSLTAADVQALAAAFLDISIPNLSSVVVVAQSAGRKMLLTGDARGDFIKKSLEDAKLIKNGTFPVDIFKVPHHGSDRNNGPSLFAAVPATHYVISADGKNGNPDDGMFKDLFTARPKGPYHIWLTNPVPKAVKFIKANAPAKVTLHLPQKKDEPLKVELKNEITW